jgi:phosphoenolpyruvate phosphomutase
MSSRQASPSSHRADSRPPFDRGAPLRAEICSPSLTFLMEAHSGLSAKIVQAAGFRGIWVSGLTISASLSNEASWTQLLEVLECRPTPRNYPFS